MQVINEESNVVQLIDGEKKYVRSRSNQSIKLQTKLIELHKPKQETKQEGEENLECLVCPSGTSAIYLTLNNLLSRYRNEKTKKNLICGNELYFQTTKTIEYLQEIHNFKLSTFDVKDSQKLTSLLKECENDDLVIVFVESASSPSGDIFDFNLIKQMKSEQMEKQKIHFVVDNTWLSSIIFNPFDYGADLVVTSLTNYYSASTNIAGAILGFPKLMKEMGKDFMMQGISVSPMLCESILQKVSTIEERLKKTSEITKKVALHLSEKFFVRHCSLDKDVSHSKSVDFYKNGLVPGVLTFVVDLDVQNTTRWLKSFDFVQYDSSYGSSKTKLDIHPKKIGDDKTLCRLSIGYSDSSEKLIDQFEKNSISSFKMK